jgi:hypothetical protein
MTSESLVSRLSAPLIVFFLTFALTMVLEEGSVKELAAAPPPPGWDRVPVTQANRQRIVDPLTAMLFSTAAGGEGLSQEACRHTLPIFDGNHRYDLKLAFKRMDKVTAEKGHAGPMITDISTDARRLSSFALRYSFL